MGVKELIRNTKNEIKSKDFPWPEITVTLAGFMTALIGIVYRENLATGLGCFTGLGTLPNAFGRINLS